MAGFLRALKKILTDNGCYFVRKGRGDHEIWFSPIRKVRFTVDAGTKSRPTGNETLKQAGLRKAFQAARRPSPSTGDGRSQAGVAAPRRPHAPPLGR